MRADLVQKSLFFESVPLNIGLLGSPGERLGSEVWTDPSQLEGGP